MSGGRRKALMAAYTAKHGAPPTGHYVEHGRRHPSERRPAKKAYLARRRGAVPIPEPWGRLAARERRRRARAARRGARLKGGPRHLTAAELRAARAALLGEQP